MLVLVPNSFRTAQWNKPIASTSRSVFSLPLFFLTRHRHIESSLYLLLTAGSSVVKQAAGRIICVRNMASSDLDPVFSRALRLLHSKSKDAEEQLKTMLDDAIKQRYGSERTLTNYLKKKESSVKRDGPTKASSSGARKEDYHKDMDKKNFEKLTEDDSGESSGTKRKSGSDILKSSHSKQVLVGAGALSASDKLVMTAIKTEPMAIKTENLKEEALNQDEAEDDLALDILEDDLTCVICRGMAIGARNQMVECVECHCLYHQECHQPPIADTEINDPRSAWYCAACTKAINKMGADSSSMVKHISGMSLTGITSVPQSASIKPTFTTSTTKSSPSFTTSGKTFGGLSQVPPKPASSSSSSTSKSVASAVGSSKVVMPNINIISAEKKLQIMKKKAAKQQEKRKHSK